MSENLQMTQGLDVSPKKIRGKTGSFQVTVSNKEEQANEYQLSAEDPDNMCTYSFDTDTMTVEAGATVTVTLTVSFKNNLPALTPKICNFTVSATKATGEVETAQGQLERPPLLPMWALVGGGVAMAAIIAIVIAVTGGGDSTVTPTFTLTMVVNGSGSVTATGGPHEYSEDEVVNITATAASGWQFDSWTGDVANSNSASTTVTMDASKTVTANFSEIPPGTETLTLTMAVNGSGSTTPAVGTHQYSEGEVINITATAASGWQFDGWTGDVPNSNSASTTVTMDADKTATANFSEAEEPVVTVTLTMAVNGSGSTTPAAGTHEYTEGDAVNITATADDGWQFDGWTGAVADSDSANTTVTMDADKTVTANFSEAPLDLSGVWRLEVFNIDSSCGPEPGWSSDVTVVHDGNTLETTGIKGTTFIVTGTVVGDTVTIGPGAFPESPGTTTATYILTIISDTHMEGREEWTWTDGGTTCDDGTADVTFTRIE
ncbi:MAG TPA: hypothetical protein G4O10_09725 [Dehalococcoidia bacterium]|nr:hypothetical protein [Dehalococcoidia bacterium]